MWSARDLRPKSYWDEAALRAQGESVRAAGRDEAPQGKKPLRRDPPQPAARSRRRWSRPMTSLAAACRELDYARRLLDVMADELCADVAVVMRPATALPIGRYPWPDARSYRRGDPFQAGAEGRGCSGSAWPSSRLG